ncbi:hypothetical protein WJ15_10690 [Burkholderia cepacia]|nr:hypothetical protein [Burkholderia cepacia]KVF64789.1 hypothetical protein WJ15_10690 [Burkholderia cepacia]
MLGDVAEHESLHAVPSMRAHHDEVAAGSARFFENAPGNAVTVRVDLDYAWHAADTGALHGRERLVGQALAFFQ